jgi:hypothetical protein
MLSLLVGSALLTACLAPLAPPGLRDLLDEGERILQGFNRLGPDLTGYALVRRPDGTIALVVIDDDNRELPDSAPIVPEVVGRSDPFGGTVKDLEFFIVPADRQPAGINDPLPQAEPGELTPELLAERRRRLDERRRERVRYVVVTEEAGPGGPVCVIRVLDGDGQLIATTRQEGAFVKALANDITGEKTVLPRQAGGQAFVLVDVVTGEARVTSGFALGADEDIKDVNAVGGLIVVFDTLAGRTRVRVRIRGDRPRRKGLQRSHRGDHGPAARTDRCEGPGPEPDHRDVRRPPVPSGRRSGPLPRGRPQRRPRPDRGADPRRGRSDRRHRRAGGRLPLRGRPRRPEDLRVPPPGRHSRRHPRRPRDGASRPVARRLASGPSGFSIEPPPDLQRLGLSDHLLGSTGYAAGPGAVSFRPGLHIIRSGTRPDRGRRFPRPAPYRPQTLDAGARPRFNSRVEPTHYDIAVVVAISFAIQMAGLVTMILAGWRMVREFRAELAEERRLTRAVGVLVIQEAEKIRATLRDAQ